MANAMPARWRTSTRSNASGGECVEVGPTPDVVGIRDTKNRATGTLTVSPTTWRAFVSGLGDR